MRITARSLVASKNQIHAHFMFSLSAAWGMRYTKGTTSSRRKG